MVLYSFVLTVIYIDLFNKSLKGPLAIFPWFHICRKGGLKVGSGEIKFNEKYYDR